MIRLYAGIDVGGTTIKSSLVDEAGRMTLGPTIPTERDALGCLTRLSTQLINQYPTVAGIGIVSPGMIDEAGGVVTYAANLELRNSPLAAVVEEATGIPTKLGHDGRAAGRAEAILGAGRGVDSFVMVPIGTGISAAMCARGQLWPGATLCAGEIGHAPVFPDGEQCSCGQRGCMEAYASASAIARRYRERTGVEVTAHAVEQLLGEDPVANEVWGDAVAALALGFTHLTLSFDPEKIIVGGGLSGAGELLLQPLRERMGKLLAWRTVPELSVAELGESAGRWGAAILGSMAAGSSAHKGWANGRH